MIALTMRIEKSLGRAVAEIDAVLEFEGALTALHRNALLLARTSVDAVRAAFAQQREENASAPPGARVDGDPMF